MTQPTYADGNWPKCSRFVWEPYEKLIPGHVTVLSTANDLIEHLGDDVLVNWPLIVAGLKNKGLIPSE